MDGAFIMGALGSSGLELDQVGQHIGFFLCAAFAAEHVFAVALEPFIDLGGVGEGFGVEGWGQRRDGFARAGVFALGCGRRAVARGTGPFAALALVEQGLASIGLGRGTGLGGPMGQLLCWAGVRGVGCQHLQCDQACQRTHTAGSVSGGIEPLHFFLRSRLWGRWLDCVKPCLNLG